MEVPPKLVKPPVDHEFESRVLQSFFFVVSRLDIGYQILERGDVVGIGNWNFGCVMLLSHNFLFLYKSTGETFSATDLRKYMEPTGGQRVSCAAISPVCPVRNVVCLVLRRKTGTPSEKNGAARRGSDGHCRNGFAKVKDNMLKYKLFVKFFKVFFRRKKLQAVLLLYINIIIRFAERPRKPPIFFLAAVCSLIELIMFETSGW